MKNPLRAFREALGLSRSQLAAAIGKSQQSIEKYEAEAPADLIESLRNYAISIGRADVNDYLRTASSEMVSPDLPKIDLPTTPQSRVQSGEVTIQVPEADLPWVQKLLQVLHSRKSGLPIAAKNNLEEFEWAATTWDELHQVPERRPASPTAGTQAAAGRAGEVAPPVQSLAGGAGHSDADDQEAARDRARLAEIEADLKGHKKRKKGTARKTS